MRQPLPNYWTLIMAIAIKKSMVGSVV
jgi:hypothetical protein